MEKLFRPMNLLYFRCSVYFCYFIEFKTIMESNDRDNSVVYYIDIAQILSNFDFKVKIFNDYLFNFQKYYVNKVSMLII